jgi:uncharacterized membrane protein YoaK (UPF0700 family)
VTQESTSAGSPSAEPMLPPVAQAALLVAIAGFTDAVGFLRYQAFACQMTGNTLLLALSLFHQSWLQSLYYLAMIACFVLGVLASSGLIRAGRSPVLALCIAGGTLAICSFIGLKWASPLLGFALGMQTAAATRFGAASINTVYITGDLQRLFEGVAARIWPKRGAPPAAGIGALALVWLEYLGGGLIGALADLTFRHALLIPAVILPFVLLRRRRRSAR